MIALFSLFKNEQSSADSFFHKGNAKLYLFHFEQHLFFFRLYKYDMPDNTLTDGGTDNKYEILSLASSRNLCKKIK